MIADDGWPKWESGGGSGNASPGGVHVGECSDTVTYVDGQQPLPNSVGGDVSTLVAWSRGQSNEHWGRCERQERCVHELSTCTCGLMGSAAYSFCLVPICYFSYVVDSSTVLVR